MFAARGTKSEIELDSYLFVRMNPQAGNPDNRLYSFVYRADGLRVKKVWHTPIEVVPAEALDSGPSKVRTEAEDAKPVLIGFEAYYLYDGPMPVCEQEFMGGVLQVTRVNFLGARGIEAVVTRDHTRGNQATLNWLLYDGHGNLVRLMAPNYTLSGFQWRGVWGEVQGSQGTGRGYCANLGHPEDETGLVYMRARYYEPATGRFISEDLSRDGVNWYLYADGKPVNRVDFEGKSPDNDSFDPVYYFNFGKWWGAYWLAALLPPLRIAIGWALGGPRGAVLVAISSVVSLAYVAASIVELYSLRLVAWYVFLFEEILSDFPTSPVIGDLPLIGFYDRSWDARNIL